MSEFRHDWSRRALLGSCGIGVAVALAGCNGGTGDGQPDESDDNADDTDGWTGERSDLVSQFSLAGTGASPYRSWLHPDLQIDLGLDVEPKQLYQFNDFTLAAEEGVDPLLNARATHAESLGADPESIEREIILGVEQDTDPNRVYLGSFDTDAVADHFTANGLEQTATLGEFTVYGDAVAVRDDAIITHPSYELLIETEDGTGERIGEVDEDVKLLLDVVPPGILTTFARRTGAEDLVADAAVVQGTNDDGERNHETRAMVFEDADRRSLAAARDLVDGGIYSAEDIVTEEAADRLVMLEIKR